MKDESLSLDELLIAGELALDSGKNAVAARLLTKALSLNPKSLTALFYLGLSKLRMGSLDEAERHFKKVLRLNPHEKHAHLNLGVLKHKQGNDRSAVMHYKKELLLNPSCLEANYNLGLMYLVTEKWKLAVQHLSQCWQRKHEAVDLAKDFALAAQKAGLTEVEKKIYTKELQRNPNDVWALNNLAACFNEKGKYRLALKLLEDATRLAPRDRTVKRNLEFTRGLIPQLEHSGQRIKR